ncbi:MAG: oligoendopeptidase F [candidate division Zixibacteria bacterium]|nr:oligoendopeptidase F [candidate division Zixibacteria bacterium]
MKSASIRIGGLLTVLLTAAATLPVGSLSAATIEIPQRSEIADEYKWNLDGLYSNLDDWQKDFDLLKAGLPRFEAYRGHLGDSARTLLECLKLRDELDILSDNISSYAYLKLDEDNRVSEYQELVGRAQALGSELSEATSFVEPELLSIDSDRLKAFLAENPELNVYRFHLEDLIRRKQHVLPEREEELMALAGTVTRAPGRIFGMLTSADMSFGTIIDEDGNEVELTEERFAKYRQSTDRRVRRDAHTRYYEAYLKNVNTFAATLGSSLASDRFRMKARGYGSCLEMSLFRNNIPTSVYHNIIEAVNDNLAPLHKWAALKKRILGVDTLHPYDLYVPLHGSEPKEYTWEEAKSVVLDGLTPMGSTYVADFERGLNSGWIDVFETKGKGTGAYSGGTYTSPPYILMNFNGSLEWVFTIAHEMGHSMQTYYVNRNEPYIYCDYSLFVAEVASTLNEAVLMKTLMRDAATREEKLQLLDSYISGIKGTFFRQVMFAEFELAIHERIESGEAVSADYFRQTFRDIYQKYWGPALAIEDIDDMLGLVVSHFYWQYYVYQYATSFAAAQMMSEKLMDGDPGSQDRIMKFLATGASKYPVDILKEAGVDLTTKEPFLVTINLFSNLVDEMERLLNEK